MLNQSKKRVGGAHKKEEKDKKINQPFSIDWDTNEKIRSCEKYGYKNMSVMVESGVKIIDYLFNAGKLEKMLENLKNENRRIRKAVSGRTGEGIV